MIYRLNVFLLSLIVAFAPAYLFTVHAGAAEAWTIEEVKYNNVGKNLSYTASRPNAIAANDYVYKANVGVTAARTGSTVANMIRMGLAGAAIYGIVEGVGWIIDNGVVKKLDDDSLNPNQPILEYSWEVGLRPNIQSCEVVKRYDSLSVALAEYERCLYLFNPLANYEKLNCSFDSPTLYSCFFKNNRNGATEKHTIQKKPNPNYNPDVQPKYIPVPDSELGEAVNDSPQAPSVLPDIYNPNNPAGGQAPQATDDALNSATPEPRTDPKNDVKNKPNKDTDGDGEPDVYDPELPSQGFEFELPKFCTWAATVCDWYIRYKEDVKKAEKHREDEQVVWTKEEAHRTTEKEVWEEEKTHRTDEKTFWQKVEDFFNWTKDDELPEKDETDLKVETPLELQNYSVSWNAQCPESQTVNVGFHGVTKDITIINWAYVCSMDYIIKPAVIAFASLSGLYIILGTHRRESD